ncbi:MAG: PIN domain-containing protein [Gemmatimonadota bacterium]|nr:PIN domain-containing protein [Gemmatimonadota bacterium]
MTIIADTGALYALVDSDDDWHEPVAAWWKENRDPIVIPVAVLPEVCYLLHTRISREAESAFVRAVADGEFVVEPLEPEDIVRAGDLLQRYADLDIGFVDATVIATAERLDSTDILTTDRRHFSVVRPRHAGALRLSP